MLIRRIHSMSSGARLIRMAHNKRSHRATLLAQMLCALIFCWFPLASASDTGQSKRLFNVIVFESYMVPSVKEGSAFDKNDWSSAEFPEVFSRLVGQPKSQNIQIPSGFQFPTNPMFIDIYTFTLTEIRINQKRKFSRRNDITELHYKLAFVSRSKDRYEVELEGSHMDLRFRDIVLEAPNDKTEMIRIRHSANRTLYFALTLLPFDDSIKDTITIPKRISSPSPPYPSQLSPSKWAGRVRILCTISTIGRVDPQDYILMECPHILFARSSLDVVLNKWKFTPAKTSGIPFKFRMAIDVPFLDFSPKLKFEMPLPKWSP